MTPASSSGSPSSADPGHLLWIPAAAIVGFAAAFIFADLLTLPVDLYYLIYFASVLAFAAYYARRTSLDVSGFYVRRQAAGVLVGVAVGLVLAWGVLTRPGTPTLSGATFWWALFWRGVAYGFVDGLLMVALPWIITWRALRAEEHGLARRVFASVVAWCAVIVVTTAYHAGYRDFRSAKMLQPNIGMTIASMATLVSANPLGGPVAHVFMHAAAVIHSPETDLYLPPHHRSLAFVAVAAGLKGTLCRESREALT